MIKNLNFTDHTSCKYFAQKSDTRDLGKRQAVLESIFKSSFETIHISIDFSAGKEAFFCKFNNPYSQYIYLEVIK